MKGHPGETGWRRDEKVNFKILILATSSREVTESRIGTGCLCEASST